MKKRFSLIVLLDVLAGFLGSLLRLCLLRFGVDERGLLIPFYPAGIAAWVLTLLSVIGGLALIRNMGRVRSPRTSPLRAAGTALAAVGTAALALGQSWKGVGLVSLLCGLAAAGCLGWLALCRFQGKRPGPYPMAVVTAFFLIHLFQRYRLWMCQPEVEGYVFSLLFSVCIMLCSYHRAALDDGGRKPLPWIRYSLASVFLGIMGLTEGHDVFFVGTVILWQLGELFSLDLQKGLKP